MRDSQIPKREIMKHIRTKVLSLRSEVNSILGSHAVIDDLCKRNCSIFGSYFINIIKKKKHTRQRNKTKTITVWRILKLLISFVVIVVVYFLLLLCYICQRMFTFDDNCLCPVLCLCRHGEIRLPRIHRLWWCTYEDEVAWRHRSYNINAMYYAAIHWYNQSRITNVMVNFLYHCCLSWISSQWSLWRSSA